MGGANGLVGTVGHFIAERRAWLARSLVEVASPPDPFAAACAAAGWWGARQWNRAAACPRCFVVKSGLAFALAYSLSSVPGGEQVAEAYAALVWIAAVPLPRA